MGADRSGVGGSSRYKGRGDELTRDKVMTSPNEHSGFKQAAEAFTEKVEGRLHAFVKEEVQGNPAVTCIWNEPAQQTIKEVVYIGGEGFDALTAVRVLNKSMKASEHVVSMLVELYTSEHGKPLGESVEY